MTSSCPDHPPAEARSSDRGRIARLAVALLIAGAALAGPAVSSTAARFTDRAQTPPLHIQVTIPAPAPTSD